MTYKPWVHHHAAKRIKQTAVHLRPCLVLERLGLQEIPKEVFDLTHLDELLVIDNLLVSVPSEIDRLKNLTRLCFFYNEIAELPPEIGSLQNLTHLDISCNKLEKLPPALKKLTKLKYLDLRFNPLPVSEKILDNVNKPQLILDAYFKIIEAGE